MSGKPRKVSIERLASMSRRGEKIVMLTVYDYPSAVIAQEAGIDIVFVGDSLAMLVLGHESTVPVTVDEMLVFMKAVARGAGTPLLLGDLPFGSYLSPEMAVTNAARLVKEGGMDAVKLEGGEEVCDIVEALVRRGMPVMGHIGLTPQTSSPHGGYRVQGKRADQALKLVRDAQALAEAGAFGVVLELVPSEVARVVTQRVDIPTIGIGSGPHCSGQVLVWHDLLGLSDSYGKHVRQYADLRGATLEALGRYAGDVRSGRFPDEDQTWHMTDEEREIFARTA